MKKKKKLPTTKLIMMGFLVGAILGSFLLILPCCLRPGVSLDFLDSAFVSTSSICVTGLSTVNIGKTYSFLGQFVLMCLIQLGGLGVVTFTTLLLIIFGKKITLEDRMLVQSAYNLDTLSGLLKMTIYIVKLTLAIELVGAMFYALVFVPEYGALGIWYSIFHSVSAFCNAGIDLLGGNSFCQYRDNIIINVTTMILIIAGGIGFPVYWEIGRCYFHKDRRNHKLNFHSRLVLIITAVLLLAGTLITLILEFNNPDTIGNLSFGNKILASAFQSVTLRTAGFATIDQGFFRASSCIVYLLLMFIGGSPAGTAGGVKTVTIALLCASVKANIEGKQDVSIMKHSITDTIIRRCVAIICFSFSVLLVLFVAMATIYPDDIMAVLYELTSAIGTVGLTRGLTAELGVAGKIIVILAMYLGRVGPISLALAFNANQTVSPISYAEGKVIIG